MAKFFMRNLISCGILLFFCGSHIVFAENSDGWQKVMIDSKNAGFIDKTSIQMVVPPVELKSKFTGDYKIADLKIPQNFRNNNGFIITSLQFDCKNSLMAFYRYVVYYRGVDSDSKWSDLDLPLFDEGLQWTKANLDNKSDYQIYNYVCKGIVPSFPQ